MNRNASESNTTELTVTLVGGFTLPDGMAATKRNKHLLLGLAARPNVRVGALLLRAEFDGSNPRPLPSAVQVRVVCPRLQRWAFLFGYPYYFVCAFLAAVRILRGGARHVLHFYGPPTIDNLPVFLAGRLLNACILFDIVEDDSVAASIRASGWHRLGNIITRSLTRLVLKHADGCLVISTRLRMKIRRAVGDQFPILIRPVSIDGRHFASLSSFLPNNSSVPRLLYAGSFGTKDGIENLLAAFYALAPRYPTLELHFTGSADKEREIELRGLIAACEYADRIFWKGFLSEGEYFAELSSATILCMVRVNTEYANAGFPFKLGEYMASGRPVLTTRVSDVADFAEDGVSVFMIEPDSVGAIVEGVVEILSDLARARKIGLAAREAALAQFDYRVQAEQFASFLSSVR